MQVRLPIVAEKCRRDLARIRSRDLWPPHRVPALIQDRRPELDRGYLARVWKPVVDHCAGGEEQSSSLSRPSTLD